MESQPQNPEFRNNPENFHTCIPPTPAASKFTLCMPGNFCMLLLLSADFFHN